MLRTTGRELRQEGPSDSSSSTLLVPPARSEPREGRDGEGAVQQMGLIALGRWSCLGHLGASSGKGWGLCDTDAERGGVHGVRYGCYTLWSHLLASHPSPTSALAIYFQDTLMKYVLSLLSTANEETTRI